MLQWCKDCYPKGCAAPGFVPCQCNTRGSLSKLKGAPPQRKINVTYKSPVGDISVVTLIRTDTTLDHSQKAEKVCLLRSQSLFVVQVAASKAFFPTAVWNSSGVPDTCRGFPPRTPLQRKHFHSFLWAKNYTLRLTMSHYKICTSGATQPQTLLISLQLLWCKVLVTLLGRGPHKNCKNDLDDQTWRELE